MTKEEMINFEDSLSSIIVNAKKLWQESRSALYDYEAEQVIFAYNIIDRFNLLAKHIEKIRPYCSREHEDEEE